MGKKGREKIRVLLVLIFLEKKVGKKLGYFRISDPTGARSDPVPAERNCRGNEYKWVWEINRKVQCKCGGKKKERKRKGKEKEKDIEGRGKERNYFL